MKNYEKSSETRSRESLQWCGSSVFANLLIFCKTFPAFMPSLFHSGFSVVALVPIIRLRIHRAPPLLGALCFLLFKKGFVPFCPTSVRRADKNENQTQL